LKDPQTAKIADFGIAVREGASGPRIWFPGYGAPEIKRIPPCCNQDVFSMGCVIVGPTKRSTRKKRGLLLQLPHLRSDPRFRKLERLGKRMKHPDPNQRCSIGEVLTELREMKGSTKPKSKHTAPGRKRPDQKHGSPRRKRADRIKPQNRRKRTDRTKPKRPDPKPRPRHDRRTEPKKSETRRKRNLELSAGSKHQTFRRKVTQFLKRNIKMVAVSLVGMLCLILLIYLICCSVDDGGHPYPHPSPTDFPSPRPPPQVGRESYRQGYEEFRRAKHRRSRGSQFV